MSLRDMPQESGAMPDHHSCPKVPHCWDVYTDHRFWVRTFNVTLPGISDRKLRSCRSGDPYTEFLPWWRNLGVHSMKIFVIRRNWGRDKCRPDPCGEERYRLGLIWNPMRHLQDDRSYGGGEASGQPEQNTGL